MKGRALLLSIKPRFADAIFAKTKRVELRRVKPKVGPGDLVLVYVSAPRSRLEGAFEVERVFAEPPSKLWPDVEKQAGVTKAEFDAYFSGRETAYGIVIRRVWALRPVSLATMRKVQIRPPQSYQYLEAIETARLVANGSRRTAEQ
jgi:predicted transcriptional regulator